LNENEAKYNRTKSLTRQGAVVEKHFQTFNGFYTFISQQVLLSWFERSMKTHEESIYNKKAELSQR